MDAPPTIETVIQAISALYHNPDASEKERASRWLQEFQRSVHSWQISDQLLRMKQDVEVCYFAAQTMRSKIQYSFHELPPDSHQALRDSLIIHIESLNDPNYQIILTQLCLALSDLALQMVMWKNSPNYLIQRFAAGTSQIPILLELLTVLPEEVHSRSLRLGMNRREEFTHELAQVAPTVVRIMGACCETSMGDHRLLGRIFKCLSSWFYPGILPSNDVAGSSLVNLLLDVLKKPDTPSMLHEAASDCICSALYAMEDIEEHLSLAETLYRGIMQLPESYALVVAGEDVDKAINYSRIFTELAEAFMEVMVETPNQGLGDLSILDAVLTCVGHCQYEVAEITFNFFYRLSEILYKRRQDKLNEIYRPYIERLVNALSTHCQMDSDHEGVPDENDDFGDFRIRVSELIKDVIFLVGSTTCFSQMFRNLASQGSTVTWYVTEASLFVMSSVAKNVLPDENGVVPQVIQAILALPDETHVAVKHTSIQMLGELSEWIDTHPQTIEPILNFLTNGLRNSQLSSVAATAIQSICKTCQDHLASHLEGLLQIAQAVDAFNLSQEAAIGLIEGTALVLTRMPLEKIQEGLKQLMLAQVTPLSQVLKGDTERKSSLSSDPTVWLDRIAAIFKNTNPAITNGQTHPCQAILQEIWPVLSNTCNTYQGDIRIIERCCRCIRFAIRCVGKGSALLLTPLVTQMVTIYQAHQHSCFLYLGSILVHEYGDDPGCIPGIIDMLQAFIVPTFQILQQPQGLRNHPDVVDDFFRLCSRLLQKCPVAFLQCSSVEPIMECALAAMSLDHREANASVCKFFHELTLGAVSKWESQDYDTRKNLILSLLEKHGPAITTRIINACVFYLPSYMMPDISEVLFELIRVNRETTSTWLEAALKSLPVETQDGRINATQKQLTDFHKTVTSAEELITVTYAMRDFTRLFR
ncbi:transportin-3-like [Patiria miniata]|uniref:Transportin-3 n=1 Tax=Patiria miniata TaxID=46514 RepID=A0A914AQE0_PATMI|nr:transportin-3-like [Patiria miniata]